MFFMDETWDIILYVKFKVIDLSEYGALNPINLYLSIYSIHVYKRYFWKLALYEAKKNSRN